MNPKSHIDTCVIRTHAPEGIRYAAHPREEKNSRRTP